MVALVYNRCTTSSQPYIFINMPFPAKVFDIFNTLCAAIFLILCQLLLSSLSHSVYDILYCYSKITHNHHMTHLVDFSYFLLHSLWNSSHSSSFNLFTSGTYITIWLSCLYQTAVQWLSFFHWQMYNISSSITHTSPNILFHAPLNLIQMNVNLSHSCYNEIQCLISIFIDFVLK